MTYIDQLREALGPDKVLDADFDRFSYSSDFSPMGPGEEVVPDVVVLPSGTEDVVKVVMVAREHGIPITPVGGMTGMLGGGLAIRGGILLATHTMGDVLEVDVANQTVRVQAGATLQSINDRLEAHALWLPHLPESKWSATVGSSIASDNDSTFGMRHGKILQPLLSVHVVDGNGNSVEFGHRKSRFTSSGYKVKDLFVGAEGTLGIVTEATLKVEPLPPYRRVEMIVMPSLTRAVDLIGHCLRSGISLEAAHINCRHRLGFYTHAYKVKHGHEPEIPDWAGALFSFAIAGDKEVVDFQTDWVLRQGEKAFEGKVVAERDIVDSWWTSKHTLDFEPFQQKWPASQGEKKFGAADVGVPMGELERFYEEGFMTLLEKHGLQVLGMNAYLEQPNSIGLSLSCAVFVDYHDQAQVDAFRAFVVDMSRKAVEMGGTSTTYMSDTYVKIDTMREEAGDALEYYRRIKEIFDPYHIMNTGKKWEDDPRPAGRDEE
ncbi:MAG: FAD-binding protein [Thermoplasmata archaeon]|nr:FAD-binding protein [Thermoplasmata archaeon]